MASSWARIRSISSSERPSRASLATCSTSRRVIFIVFLHRSSINHSIPRYPRKDFPIRGRKAPPADPERHCRERRGGRGGGGAGGGRRGGGGGGGGGGGEDGAEPLTSRTIDQVEYSADERNGPSSAQRIRGPERGAEGAASDEG